ncbi:hypothetical protein CN563_11720 [Bacillus sp. AFS026049]|uniref:hypothetical protein n=1 Tax=Peribacillus frigoritolerans TaxID=450367 RepID=UPI000BEC437C|nr:hypothetical protein CON84_19080 [Bacillus sp. AFS094228]PEO47340.1 hypothetical protein CN563_11720 [Bacillus sp. AFS026049]
MFSDLFCYLKGVKKDQKYWLALGNKQFVYNKGGAFVAKAEKAYNKIKDLTEESDSFLFRVIWGFGRHFYQSLFQSY